MPLRGLAALAVLACAGAWGQTPPAAAPRPPNIILVLCDQERFALRAPADYALPARAALQRRGVTFHNHYIGSAMCSPSRAVLFSGQPPQVNGLFDQLEMGYVPSLPADRPSLGKVMKQLGYRTGYFGKFELDYAIVFPTDTVNYSTALQPYGFDAFSSSGDVTGLPEQGYEADAAIAGQAVSWLRTATAQRDADRAPFFLVVSFLNPHDIMYADANVPGLPKVQSSKVAHELTAPPANDLYRRSWAFTLSPTLGENLAAPGLPPALATYHTGWSDLLGHIPADRADMWRIFYNYYLNLLRDNDRSLQQVVNALDELDLWRDTIVIFTADHGEMAGDHGALRGKGPMCYEGNAHVPLIIAHPAAPPGSACRALTSHLDLLPTIAALTGLPAAQRAAATGPLPGRDFSGLLARPQDAAPQAVRPAVLFNYVGLLTVDAGFLTAAMAAGEGHQPRLPVTELAGKLGARGFLSFVFDGRYKYARFYSPQQFNTPTTLEEIFQYNDVQLFDLAADPEETVNLALDREKNAALILRLNTLLNDMIAREVGANDGAFLPAAVRPPGPVRFNAAAAP